LPEVVVLPVVVLLVPLAVVPTVVPLAVVAVFVGLPTIDVFVVPVVDAAVVPTVVDVVLLVVGDSIDDALATGVPLFTLEELAEVPALMDGFIKVRTPPAPVLTYAQSQLDSASTAWPCESRSTKSARFQITVYRRPRFGVE